MSAIEAALAGFACPIYACVDGTAAGSALRLARSFGLDAQPLMLETARPDEREAGPHLLSGKGARGVAAAADGLETAVDAVFWAWPGPSTALVRHLRSLNLAEIPAEDRRPGDPAYEAALFRHWDARALGSAVRVMSWRQVARLLGEAEALVFSPIAFEPPRVLRPSGVEAAHGLLRFSPAQLDSMEADKAGESRRAVAAYVRACAPADWAVLGPRGQHELIERSEAHGRALGLEGERAIGQWTWLMLVTGGACANDPDVTATLSHGAGTPDDRLDAIMAALPDALGRQAELA
jgi:hypothetical protein